MVFRNGTIVNYIPRTATLTSQNTVSFRNQDTGACSNFAGAEQVYTYTTNAPATTGITVNATGNTVTLDR